MTTKICSTCNELKSLDEFPTMNSHLSYKTTGQKLVSHSTVCRPCKAAHAREWRKKNTNYKGSGRIKSIPLEDRMLVSAISERLRQAKERIKKYNQIETNLTRDYLYEMYKTQKGLCAISGVQMKVEKYAITCLSLDKIKPELGYIVGNVQWVAWAVNRAKGDMDEDVFINMCQKIVDFQKVQRLSKGRES